MNKFAVVDLETTGGLSRSDRITEVGIVLIDDGKIVDTFSSLVNPERSIPEFVSKITGITNSMVRDAPKFYEIAKEVVLLTEGRIFVAHNVNFDYGFLRQEFEQLGFTYSRKKICTVKLAKKLFPDLSSHGLSNLVESLNLPMDNRHRALDDARATAHFLMKCLAMDSQKEIEQMVNLGIQVTKLPKHLDMDHLHELPENPGVYFFEDEDGRYLYIGKSKNIQKRVMQHFRKSSRKSDKMHEFIYHISYEETAGELIALLKEDEYIKKYAPPINIAQRKNSFPYCIVKLWDEKGIYFDILKLSKKQKTKHNILAEFASDHGAKNKIDMVCKELQLCQCELTRKDEKQCWQRQLKICKKANESDPSEQFERHINNYFSEDFLIKEPIPLRNASGVVLIQDGICKAYGEISNDIEAMNMEQILEQLTAYQGSSYSNRIIQRHINKKKELEIIKLESLQRS